MEEQGGREAKEGRMIVTANNSYRNNGYGSCDSEDGLRGRDGRDVMTVT